MGLSSNILWHQTNKESFYEILKSKKLRYSYCLEKIIYSLNLDSIAFPMISVSDYPLSEIGNNKWAYGNYNIGFTQEWGVKAGFSPVWYCSFGSCGLFQLNKLLVDAIKTESESLLSTVMYMFSNMKFVQGALITHKKRYKEYRYYDEREWRCIPGMEEMRQAKVIPALIEKHYKKYKKTHDGSSLLDMGVEFQYDNIHYIIVEKDEDVQKTKDIVGDRTHIFTKEEVVEDVIGVEHHKEILPSPEQQDYEAALRHLNRTKKMWDEVLENMRGNKDNEE